MVFLGLGSNLGDREKYITDAVDALCRHEQIEFVQCSSLYETEPFGVKDQPSYLNAVLQIATTLPPINLLTVTAEIEHRLGRVRNLRWEARSIDIDILVYHDQVFCSETLTIPHPYLHKRNFVLIPLAEIAGTIPVYDGHTPSELLAVSEDTCEVQLFKKRWFSGGTLYGR